MVHPIEECLSTQGYSVADKIYSTNLNAILTIPYRDKLNFMKDMDAGPVSWLGKLYFQKICITI